MGSLSRTRYGPELVVDGDFEADSPLWNWGTNWSRQSGSPPPGGSGFYAFALFKSIPPPNEFWQELDVEFGVLYEFNCVFEFSGTSVFDVNFGGNYIGKANATPLQGVFTNTKKLRFFNFGTLFHTGKIDNVSLKRVLTPAAIFAHQLYEQGIM